MLNPKQQRFVDEYLIDLNASRAAAAAGYAKASSNVTGARLLASPNIKLAIKDANKLKAKQLTVSKEQVVAELAKLAFSDITDFIEVREIDLIETGLDGEQTTRKVKFVDVFTTEGMPKIKTAAIQSIKQTKDGIEIKLHDKGKALEMLGRHLGVFEVDNDQKKPLLKPFTDDQFDKMLTILNGKK